jgi:uncharacterized membrane protein YedE/YeeE
MSKNDFYSILVGVGLFGILTAACFAAAFGLFVLGEAHPFRPWIVYSTLIGGLILFAAGCFFLWACFAYPYDVIRGRI